MEENYVDEATSGSIHGNPQPLKQEPPDVVRAAGQRPCRAAQHSVWSRGACQAARAAKRHLETSHADGTHKSDRDTNPGANQALARAGPRWCKACGSMRGRAAADGSGLKVTAGKMSAMLFCFSSSHTDPLLAAHL